MKKEDKDLLLKDLCARLPYGVIIEGLEHPEIMTIKHLAIISVMPTEPYKPYLRPMSSMTKEGTKELFKEIGFEFTCNTCGIPAHYNYEFAKQIKGIPTITNVEFIKVIDWLNKKMFDYRGLIEKGLALEAPEGMYNHYKE